MKKYIIGISVGLALCLAGCAFARGDTFAPRANFARSGGVIGVEGGYGFLNTPEINYPKDFSNNTGYPFPPVQPLEIINYQHTNDKGDFVWGIHAGYEFLVAKNVILGIELGYKDLGKSKASWDYLETYTSDDKPPVVTKYDVEANRKVNQAAIDALLTARWYVWEGLNLFGKAGMAYVSSTVDQDVTATQPGGVEVDNLQPWDGKTTIWRFRPEFALGIAYLFGNHVNAYVMYDHIGGANNPDEWVPLSESLGHASTRAETYNSNAGVFGLEYKF